MTNYKIIGGDGRQYGPIPASEVRQWIAEGRLNVHSLAQAEAMTEWQPLGKHREFAEVFGLTAVPPIASPESDAAAWSRRIITRSPELRIGDCLASGFRFVIANPGFVIGGVTLAWLLKGAVLFLPVIGGILYLLLAGVVTGGLYRAALRRLRGEPAGIASIFDGFKFGLLQLMLAGAVTGLLTQFGFLFCLLPGVYFVVAWAYTLPLVADRGLEFWSAMELSRRVVTRVWFRMLGLLLLIYLPFLAAQTLAGVKVLGFVLDTLRDKNFEWLAWLDSLPRQFGPLMKLTVIWAMIGQAGLLISQYLAVGTLMCAYEKLFGERPA